MEIRIAKKLRATYESCVTLGKFHFSKSVICTGFSFRCKKNKIEKLLESEKGITDSVQKVTLPSSGCDVENDQKYNSEEKENLHKRKNARKEKLVARKEFELNTSDLENKEVEKQIEDSELNEDNPSSSKAKKSYECCLCGEVISAFIDFKAHLEKFHKEKISEIPPSERIKDKSLWSLRYKKQDENICHVCAKSYKVQTLLDKHVFYDHDSSPESDHKCETCIAYFFNETDLLSHIKNIHGGEKMCDQCGKTFEMPSVLKKHYNDVHYIRKICEICGYEGKTTGSKSKSIRAHMLEKHPDQSRLGCQICNHQSATLRDAYVHFQVMIKLKGFLGQNISNSMLF